jgi:hypothetical protein
MGLSARGSAVGSARRLAGAPASFRQPVGFIPLAEHLKKAGEVSHDLAGILAGQRPLGAAFPKHPRPLQKVLRLVRGTV